jgi:predicted nucleic acid-binding protein
VDVLVDTNVLLRRVLVDDPMFKRAKTSIDNLILARSRLVVAPQNLIELRAVATRPSTANGLGLTSEEANEATIQLEVFFELLPESPEIYPRWRQLVSQYKICGKQVHDARLVAVMMVNHITNIITFNGNDFKRYQGITVLEP